MALGCGLCHQMAASELILACWSVESLGHNILERVQADTWVATSGGDEDDVQTHGAASDVSATGRTAPAVPSAGESRSVGDVGEAIPLPTPSVLFPTYLPMRESRDGGSPVSPSAAAAQTRPSMQPDTLHAGFTPDRHGGFGLSATDTRRCTAYPAGGTPGSTIHVSNVGVVAEKLPRLSGAADTRRRETGQPYGQSGRTDREAMPSPVQVAAFHGSAVATLVGLSNNADTSHVNVGPSVWLGDDGSGGSGGLPALTRSSFKCGVEGTVVDAPQKHGTSNALTASPGEITHCRFWLYSSKSPINVSRHERSHTGVKPLAGPAGVHSGAR